MKRVNILKTYKVFIEGKFCRTESGRYFQFKNTKGNLIANISNASRKDFRNCVSSARKAQESWANLTSLNRGQILYRMGEILEDRKKQFIDLLILSGYSKSIAQKEVDATIDRLIYYAGWSDKYQQVFSSVNPVSTDHFNFSILEPVGVVSIVAPEESPLLGLVSLLAPSIVGGNSVIVLASNINPMIAISFSEIFNSSDVPPGVINILTGMRKELLNHFASHKDVNSIIYAGDNVKELKKIKELSIENLKRVHVYKRKEWDNEKGQSLYFIEKCQEIKTIWHPTEV